MCNYGRDGLFSTRSIIVLVALQDQFPDLEESVCRFDRQCEGYAVPQVDGALLYRDNLDGNLHLGCHGGCDGAAGGVHGEDWSLLEQSRIHWWAENGGHHATMRCCGEE